MGVARTADYSSVSLQLNARVDNMRILLASCLVEDDVEIGMGSLVCATGSTVDSAFVARTSATGNNHFSPNAGDRGC